MSKVVFQSIGRLNTSDLKSKINLLKRKGESTGIVLTYFVYLIQECSVQDILVIHLKSENSLKFISEMGRFFSQLF
jgi:hypothetical protein